MEEKNKEKVAILFGGCSSEYEVSLQSAYAVITHMDLEKYEVFLIGIAKTGEWYLYQGDPANIPGDNWQREKDCIPAAVSFDKKLHGILLMKERGVEKISVDKALPILHGKNGEDGTVQGVLELAGIPVIGCNTMSSAICMDKETAHRLAGSSFGITRVTKPEELQDASTLLYLPLKIYSGNVSDSVGGWLKEIFFDGTFYHLWYLPAVILGCLLLIGLIQFLNSLAITAVVSVLYVFGVLGDSYYGLVSRIPIFRMLYEGVFTVSSYTRNGIFFAPAFLWMGVVLANGKVRFSGKQAKIGFGISMAGMLAEGFLSFHFQWQKHNSMYFLLIPVMLFLFELLLSMKGKKVWDCERSVYVSIYVELNLENLKHNVGEFRRLLSSDCALMPAVKANAYGHGALLVAKALQEQGIRAFCVASVREGIELRQAGITGKLLVLGYTHPSQFDDLIVYHLIQTVVDGDYARAGIALYGIFSEKDDRPRAEANLKPVLSLKTRVESVKMLYKGEGAGYGLTYHAGENRKIAALSIGYADGIPRELSNCGYVLCNDQQ